MEAVDFLGQVSLFKGLSTPELTEVAEALQPRDYEPGAIIVSQGGPGLGFFIVSKGSVDVVREGKPVAQLGPGSFFGEMSLLAERPRTATVVAREPTQCLVLATWDFRELLAKKPEISMDLLKLVCRRAAELEKAPAAALSQKTARAKADEAGRGADSPIDAAAWLRRAPIFGALTDAELADLASVARECSFPSGAIILSQGRQGLGFYVIGEGRVQVQRDRELVAELEPGAFFGEISLLSESPRMATIVAVEATRCLVIGSWDLKALLGNKPEIALKMLEVMSTRLRVVNKRRGLD